METSTAISLSHPVVQWLSTLGLQGHSEAIIQQGGIDCLHKVAQLGDADLRRLGIDIPAHCQNLLRGISKLRKSVASKVCTCSGSAVARSGDAHPSENVSSGVDLVPPCRKRARSESPPGLLPRSGFPADLSRAVAQIDQEFFDAIENSVLPQFVDALQKQCDTLNAQIRWLEEQREAVLNDFHRSLGESAVDIAESGRDAMPPPRAQRRLQVEVTLREWAAGSKNETNESVADDGECIVAEAAVPQMRKALDDEENSAVNDTEMHDGVSKIRTAKDECNSLGLRWHEEDAVPPNPESLPCSQYSVTGSVCSFASATSGLAECASKAQQALRRMDCRKVFASGVIPWVQTVDDQAAPTARPKTESELASCVVCALAAQSMIEASQFVVFPSPTKTLFERVLLREGIPLADAVSVVQQLHPNISKTAISTALTKAGVPLEVF